jgi:type I pantothenate kinase
LIDGVAALLRERAAQVTGRPLLVAIAGSVAVGKSTLAAELEGRLVDLAVAVVPTDCFLEPNAVLAERGLLMRKGFPSSYGEPEIATFLEELASVGQAEVPVYSHRVYDRIADQHATIGPADVVIIEGVNALQPVFASRIDVGIYLDAEVADVERWFVTRFLQLCVAARTDETSFYRIFAERTVAEQEGIALATWTGINLVNLEEHIAATKAAADLVVTKSADHTYTSISSG